jgi:hypothetical protein
MGALITGTLLQEKATNFHEVRKKRRTRLQNKVQTRYIPRGRWGRLYEVKHFDISGEIFSAKYNC